MIRAALGTSGTTVDSNEEVRVSRFEEQIEVDVPVRTAYNQWTQFETFPQFMEGVESVEQKGDEMTHWVVEIAGKRREFDARVSYQSPDEQVSWRVVNGTKHDGTVFFLPLGADRTRVTLRMEFEPEGFAEKAGDMLGIVSSRIKGDLERFREFIEKRGVETGAWRGEVPKKSGVSPQGTSPVDRGVNATPGQREVRPQAGVDPRRGGNPL